MAGYVEIGIEEFRDMVETEMGFKCINGGEDGGRAKEYIYERIVQHRNEEDFMSALRGDKFRYSIRIFSSIDKRTNITRESGQDAIRVTLFDTEKQRPVRVEKRVHRTKNALTTMRKRAREMWKYVATKSNTCPECKSLLVKRTAKRTKKDFMGCSKFPECKHTQDL